MIKEEVNKLLDNAKFVFAKSMPKIPHEYSHRNTWANDSFFCDVVLWIRENGIRQSFFKKEFIYYYYNGYKYWTMGNPVSYEDKTKTFILNRAKI
jgi:hypothetical protein